MKLTLSSGGGITGLTQEHSVDLESLDDNTRTAVLKYINNIQPQRAVNFGESWRIDEKEAHIDRNKMNKDLLELYNSMKKKLEYK